MCLINVERLLLQYLIPLPRVTLLSPPPTFHFAATTTPFLPRLLPTYLT